MGTDRMGPLGTNHHLPDLRPTRETHFEGGGWASWLKDPGESRVPASSLLVLLDPK